MSTSQRYTSADLECLPDIPGVRYEIIDGELHVSKQPHLEHQYTNLMAGHVLVEWSRRTGQGVTLIAPGLVFAQDQDVAPDLVWVSHARLAQARDQAGHLRLAPELVVEVLSPGSVNERRDRELKLRLYSRQGVQEYWILEYLVRRVRVYRRAEAALQLVATLEDGDELTTPLLPGFRCAVAELWYPAAAEEGTPHDRLRTDV